MEIINFVTTNKFKFQIAQDKLDFNDNIKLFQKKLDCIEIQAETIKEVAVYSAQYSVNQLGSACIKNDSGLVIPALKGFPGPYTSYVEDTIGVKGVLNLMEDIEDRRAKFVEVLAFARPGEKPVTFKCVTKGHISKKIRGEHGWSFDRIFIPEGYDKTFAEFEDEERSKLWDSSGYKKLSDFVNKIYESR